MAKDEAKEHDFLDEVKQIERSIRAQALAKMLTTLKEKAHEVLELKQYITDVLEELGVESADAKRLIDWINSLDSVKLTSRDQEKIKEEARRDVHSQRKEAEKKVTEKAFQSYSFTAGSTNQSMPAVYAVNTATTGTLNAVAMSSATTTTVSSGGSNLDVKLR